MTCSYFALCCQAAGGVAADTNVCVCLCVSGVSLLVPHGSVAENMSWEMYMVINQGEAR